ncbi:hypothetical protein HK098_003723 [Nowakowskiella sp. JEL0407]|nr:hypothetical protein HK098_003723 [Nowakowskiella sp. JEL0407]
MKDLTNFIFELISLHDHINLSEWAKYMDEIPADPYVHEGYRFKSIGWFRVKRNDSEPDPLIDQKIMSLSESSNDADRFTSKDDEFAIWHLPLHGLQQSADYNPVHGNICRYYSGIPLRITERKDFTELLVHYAKFMEWNDDVVLLQFQRIRAFKDVDGITAVEGFHKDGNEHAGMLIVQRRNVVGGVSQVSTDSEGKNLVLDQVLPVGCLIYWNDKSVWHYATPIKVSSLQADSEGFRDVVLMSAGATQHMGKAKTITIE